MWTGTPRPSRRPRRGPSKALTTVGSIVAEPDHLLEQLGELQLGAAEVELVGADQDAQALALERAGGRATSGAVSSSAAAAGARRRSSPAPRGSSKRSPSSPIALARSSASPSSPGQAGEVGGQLEPGRRRQRDPGRVAHVAARQAEPRPAEGVVSQRDLDPRGGPGREQHPAADLDDPARQRSPGSGQSRAPAGSDQGGPLTRSRVSAVTPRRQRRRVARRRQRIPFIRAPTGRRIGDR